MKLKFITMISLAFVLILSPFSIVHADTKDRSISTYKYYGCTTVAKKANISGVYLKVSGHGSGEFLLVSVFADANKGKGKRNWVNVSGRDMASLGKYVKKGNKYHLTNYAVERYGKNVPIRLCWDAGSKSTGKVSFLWSPDSR
ncbi:hypothetical protein ABD83_00030 [Bacillus xiamenensis]|uniref:DUF2712 domain-containing protein n=1 Tax=Bacillus xiamenensis TaxID=1178537 RepID=A0ABT4EWM2_9BACI|nr:hypothetical protein [Bacillus xiamenensis]MBG9909883.1 hypothetical protein [Bacillus xiamenensis]MCY9574217.1 hypothetical protein [Bacillus xiamenensis]